MKSSEYIIKLNQELKNMKSKKGVVKFRQMVERARELHARFDRLINGTMPFNHPYRYDKFLWKHGYKQVQYLDIREKACKLALKSAPLYYSDNYDALHLATNPNTYFEFKDLPENTRVNYRYIFGDLKALNLYKKIHTKKYTDILAELQAQNFIPRKNLEYNSRNEVIEAVNIDMYGMDSEAGLYLIQVRYWRKGKRYNTKRKDYFLIGRNENNSAFCHSVEVAAFRNKKAYTPEEKIRAAQSWIFGVKYDQMAEVIRQGDMGFMPLKKALPKNSFIDLGKTHIVGESHVIHAEQILQDVKTNKIYALRPVMKHSKNQHDDIFCTAWAEILVGKRKPVSLASNSKD